MARLTDGPISTESLDAARRRFLRQNRDLARINSNHSIRIHNLEAEKSRLLSENIALHEENIQLKVELVEKREHATFVDASVDEFRKQFDEQLQCLQKLASDFQVSRQPSLKTQRHISSPSAIQDWRLTISRRSSQGDEQRLPTIVEDKSYPRRTLDADEIRSVLSNQATDSPDLGPPPVVNFDVEDSIKLDTDEEARMSKAREEDLFVTDLSANLETRRKRRDSFRMSVHRGIPASGSERLEVGKDSNENRLVKLPIRNGAKRKYQDREAETTARNASMDKEDFYFSRKGERSDQLDRRREANPDRSLESSREEHKNSSSRRPLGDKNVNTDPASPKKLKPQKRASLEDYQKPKTLSNTQPASRKPRIQSDRSVKSDLQTLESTKSIGIAADSERLSGHSQVGDIGPLTLPSPRSRHPAFRNLPPPSSLASESNVDDNVALEQVRPSRRARSAVNYAEPNLNRKMRRPTGAKVDAIGREERRQSSADIDIAALIKSEEEDVSGRKSSLVMAEANKDDISKQTEVKKRTVIIKTEGNLNSDWQTLPIAIPEQSSSSDNDVKTTTSADPTILNDRNQLNRTESQPTLSRTSLNEVAALIATDKQASRKRVSSKSEFTNKAAEKRDDATDPNHVNRLRRSSLAVYDVHSSPTIDSSDNPDKDHDADKEATVNHTAIRARRLNSTRNRRISTGLGNTVVSSNSERDRIRDDTKNESDMDSNKSQQHDNTAGKAMVGPGNALNEAYPGTKGRVASRRRSMML